MVSFKKAGGVDTGGFSEKVVALTQYGMKIIGSVHQAKGNKELIERGAANIIATYFERYVDARARADHYKFHHIYEWDKTGNANAGLFKKTITNTPSGALIKFNFTKSKEPNRDGYIFANKASVMESGQTVVIKPRNSSLLVYSVGDKQVITKNPSVVENPGGTEVAGSFTTEWKNFTNIQAKRVLKEYKYFERINEAIKHKRKSIVPRINSGNISGILSKASNDANSIAMKAAVISNV